MSEYINKALLLLLWFDPQIRSLLLNLKGYSSIFVDVLEQCTFLDLRPFIHNLIDFGFASALMDLICFYLFTNDSTHQVNRLPFKIRFNINSFIIS